MWIWWGVVVAVNVGTLLALFALRRHAKAQRLLGVATLAFLALVFLGGPLSALFVMRASVGGDPVEPSQKARILAEGIAELMNCTAFALLSLGVPAVVACSLYLRARRKARD